jgi:hypothetical protein
MKEEEEEEEERKEKKKREFARRAGTVLCTARVTLIMNQFVYVCICVCKNRLSSKETQ